MEGIGISKVISILIASSIGIGLGKLIAELIKSYWN